MSATVRTVVIDWDVEQVRRLRKSSNLEAGIVAAAVPPDMRRSYELTWEILEAIGKCSGVSGAGRDESLNWEVLVAWILAHEVRHLVLVDAQWLRRPMLEDAIGLAAATGIVLWLVAQRPLEDEYEHALTLWPHQPAGDTDLAELIELAAGNDDSEAPAPFPPVPFDNFATFRAEARRQLGAEDFSVLDRCYVAAFEQTLAWFDAQDGQIDEMSLLGLIRAQMHRCSCAEEMVTVLRSIQAVTFLRGWLVSAELARLVVTAERAAAAAIHSPQTWVRLRAYRQPYRGAACALAACELSLSAMSSITLGDVASDGTSVMLVQDGQNEVIELPSGAETYLRALVWHRRIQGAANDHPLFAAEDTALSPRTLADAIRCPISEVGVPLYSQQVERADLDERRWSRRWGLSVRPL